MTDEPRTNQTRELAALLAAIAPTLRARIRSRKSPSHGAFSTSDIYATVVRRTLTLKDHEAVQPPDSATVRETPRLWAILHTLIDRALWRMQRQEDRERVVRDGQVERAPVADQPAVRIEDEELRRRLVVVVDALDDADRDLLQLRLNGASWSEIAAHLGTKAGTCRQHWHRITKSIGQSLSE